MLKFFRKIRKELLSENQFSKYLFYAIGEIILVVIGILIALQINNWNEVRKDRRMEKQTLEAILDNLIEDEENLNHSMQNFVNAQRCIERLIFPSEVPKDSLSYLFSQAYQFSNYLPIRAAFDRSISSGRFDLIQDGKLGQKIQRLYSFELKQSDFQLTTLLENHSEMRGFAKEYSIVELRSPKTSGGFYDASFTMAFNPDSTLKLLASEKMKKLNKSYFANASMISAQYKYMKGKSQEVQEAIKVYLKSKN